MQPLHVLSLASLALGFNLSGSRRPLEQRIPNSCSTLTGSSCVFPFSYQGTTHYQCTYTDSPTPWCATAVDAAGAVVTNGWGDCAVTATSGCTSESITVPTCTTESGPRPGQACVFPFRHLGITYQACTSVGQSAAWCSTSTTSAGTHIDGEYGFCPASCPSDSSAVTTTTTTTTTPAPGSCTPGTTFTQDCNTCVCDSTGSAVCTTLTCTTTPAPSTCTAESGPAAGSACVFPFIYAGTSHSSCAEWVYGGEHQGKFWCSTQVDSTGTHVNGEGNYGFCSSACSAGPKSEFSPFRAARPSSQGSAVVFGGSRPAGRRPF